MNDIVQALLFFLPAGVANMTPVLANKLPILRKWHSPLDFGWSWNGSRIFGDNKTWRGLVTGTLLAAVAALLIDMWQPSVYSNTAVLSGMVLGIGALFGDALESSFKRRRGIGPGKSWFPFDQTDYIIGGLAAIYLIEKPDLQSGILILGLYFGLHLFVSYVGYLLKLKERPI